MSSLESCADTMVLHPMDFEEYLWAMKVDQRVIDHAKECIMSRLPIDGFYHKILRNHFLRFLIVGGMPEAVRAYCETTDYCEAKATIKGILKAVRTDAGKYSGGKADKKKIIACMESIPSQLESGERRFLFQDIEAGSGGRRRYEEALDWLISAGIACRCNNLKSIDAPLPQSLKEKMFKMYMCDTGLLLGLMDSSVPGSIILSDPFSCNGAVMENAVASALVKKGHPLCYYAKEKSTLEIGFVTDGCPIRLIDVRSEKDRRSKSLSTLLSEKGRDRIGIRICDGNVEADGSGALRLPLYGACFLPDPSANCILPMETSCKADEHDR